MPAAGLLHLELHGQSAGHRVQPATDGIAAADRAGLAGQHQERGLEGIIEIRAAAQDAPADAHHQGAVAADQGGEGAGVAGGGEALQELAVAGGVGGQRVQVVQQIGQGSGGHAVALGGWAPTSIEGPG